MFPAFFHSNSFFSVSAACLTAFFFSPRPMSASCASRRVFPCFISSMSFPSTGCSAVPVSSSGSVTPWRSSTTQYYPFSVFSFAFSA